MNNEYKESLLKIKEQMILERNELAERASELNQKVKFISEKISSIEKLLKPFNPEDYLESKKPQKRLRDEIKEAMIALNSPSTIIDIISELRKMFGYNVNVASVAAYVSRLVSRGDLEVVRKDGKAHYFLKSSNNNNTGGNK